MLGKIEGERRGCQGMRWMYGISDAIDMNLGKLQDLVRDGKTWWAALHGRKVRHDWVTEQQQ